MTASSELIDGLDGLLDMQGTVGSDQPAYILAQWACCIWNLAHACYYPVQLMGMDETECGHYFVIGTYWAAIQHRHPFITHSLAEPHTSTH